MDIRLRDRITEAHETLGPNTKEHFLKTLRDDPQEVQRHLQYAIPLIRSALVSEIGEPIPLGDVVEESAELVAHFKQHFSRELAAL